MSRSYRVYQVDAFTQTPFQGNPAGVVPDAEGLTDTEMQAIARELNNSETAFLFPPDSDDHDLKIRFFTPTVEVPSCGHATIAAHFVNAIENKFDSVVMRQKSGIGILPIEIEKFRDSYRIHMVQGSPEFLNIISGDRHSKLLNTLDLNNADLDDRVPVQIVSTGHSKVLIGVKSRERLNNIIPDQTALKSLSVELKCNGYFLYTLESNAPDILTHCRMFAPAIGIDEDPVTGNGNGPLGAFLVKNGIVNHHDNFFEFKSKQGEVMQKPGIVHVHVTIKDGCPVKVKVAGDAVIVFKTEIKL